MIVSCDNINIYNKVYLISDLTILIFALFISKVKVQY